MSEIGKAIDNEAIEARKAYIINYLHKMDITHHAGTMLEDMTVRDLEPIYIKEIGKEARAFGE
jgi:hypothetical protein